MPTDKEMLDFLQKCSGRYTGRVVCRWSGFGRGWRLHETSHSRMKNVRKAIWKFMKENGWKKP